MSLRYYRLALLAGLSSLAVACTAAPESFWFVRSQSADMPVLVRGKIDSGKLLVFLHGGPGENALVNIDRPVFKELETEMGIVYWDQRASGSSRGNANADSLNLNQFVTDLDQVVQTLQQHYPSHKLILMGYSWGGGLGTAYLQDKTRQARITGWINLDGATDVPEANKLSREFMLKQVQAKIDQKEDVANWQAALDFYLQHPVLDLESFPQHLKYVEAMEDSLTTSYQNIGVGSLGLNLFSPYNPFSRLLNSGYVARNMVLTPDFLKINLTNQLAEITLPSRVLWGRHDARLPLAFGEKVFQQLGTPAAQKKWIVFEKAAHTAFSQEPASFKQAVSEFVSSL
jgi:pimeloyl-ACP methyl ester carboxylesterase